MKTSEFIVEDVKLLAPDFLPDYWPNLALESFPRFCGPGAGFADRLIPETMYGLVVSAACFIHDICWCVADATWAAFHHSNSMFLHNILAIVDARSGRLLKIFRRNRALFYYFAVDTIGAHYFWRDKEEFGNYNVPIAHPVVVEKLSLLGVSVPSLNITKPLAGLCQPLAG